MTTKHGMYETRFYGIWERMKERCLNKKHTSYSRYGARGITVCKSWLKFKNFYRDLYESYSIHVDKYGEKNTTLNRIIGTKGYSKRNCNWATYKEQAKNMSSNVIYKGECATDASRRLGCNDSLVSSRLRDGWSKKDAFTIPKSGRYKHKS